MHRRLDECFPTAGVTLGNRDWLLFGDLMQLKPVKALFVFEQLETRDTGSILSNATSLINIWAEFEYTELTTNMRHKTDMAWADLNQRVRLGNTSVEDDLLLQSRVIKRASTTETDTERACRVYNRLLTEHRPNDILIICSKKVQCSNINHALLDELTAAKLELKATDDKKTTKKQKAIKDSDAGGLPTKLVCFVWRVETSFIKTPSCSCWRSAHGSCYSAICTAGIGDLSTALAVSSQH